MSAGPVGRREVAVRCFAAEYDDADLSYSESDEERAPNYVVTPTGARINRLFAVGVLTEVEAVSDDVLRGRIVDPTGAFVVYAGQYQPEAKTALERLEPPAFVAVTGKARTFEPDDGDRVYTSVRPESISEVDAGTRDRWTVQAAEQTLDRVAVCAAALERAERGAALTDVLEGADVDPALAAGIPRAIDHYGTTPAYLAAVRELALQAAAVVAGERDEVDPLSADPDGDGPVDVDLTGDVDLGATAAGGPGPVAEADEAPGAAEPAADDPPTADGAEPAGSTDGPAVASGAADEPAEADTAAAPTSDEPLGDFEGGGAAEPEAGETAGEPARPEDVGADPEYELDEAEIEAVEAEYGTEFSTGNEVDAPGEADLEAPDPGESAAGDGVGAEPEADETAESAPDESEPEAEEGPDATGEEPDEAETPGSGGDDAVDLVEAAVVAMGDLDDGDGAERTAVIEAVVDGQGADASAVEDAIDTALMEGRCYEPDDEHLKAI